MAATSVRWGAFRSIGLALRRATRPGSAGMVERLGSVPRLLVATFQGRYAGTSRGRLVLMLAAALYVVSPIDLMPEGLLGIFGLGDDAIVVTWLAAAVVNETEGFLAWERDRARTVPSHAV